MVTLYQRRKMNSFVGTSTWWGRGEGKSHEVSEQAWGGAGTGRLVSRECRGLPWLLHFLAISRGFPVNFVSFSCLKSRSRTKARAIHYLETDAQSRDTHSVRFCIT